MVNGIGKLVELRLQVVDSVIIMMMAVGIAVIS